MYGWIWRHLPGGTASRALVSAVLVLGDLRAAAVRRLPVGGAALPFNDVTVGG